MTTRKSCSILAATTGHNLLLFPPSFRSNTPLYSTSFIAAKQLLNQHHRFKSASANVPSLKDRINPPNSTLPAPLDIPARKPDQNFAKWILQSGKLYLGFYKSGIKNIWLNYKTTRALRSRLNATKTPQLPPSPSKDGKGRSAQTNLHAKFALTRAEFQFLRRSRHDFSRVPVFALLFAVLGEWLPLVVIFVTPLVPYPCRIPKQILKARESLEKRRSESFRGITDGYVPNSRGQKGEVRELKELNKGQLMHISRSLGLHFGFWDRTRGHVPPEVLLRWKVRRWLKYLDQDDALLKRDGGAAELKGEELKLAAEQRGIDVLAKRDDELKTHLEMWLRGRGEGKILAMLLTR
jgi:hypothetical protein